MDYTKFSDRELGAVIKHHEWVEGSEIGDWVLDIGVGTGSKRLCIHHQVSTVSSSRKYVSGQLPNLLQGICYCCVFLNWEDPAMHLFMFQKIEEIVLQDTGHN